MKLWLWIGTIRESTPTTVRILESGGWLVAAKREEAIGQATITLDEIARAQGRGWTIGAAPTLKEIDAKEMRKALALVDADAAEDAAESA